MASQRKYFQEMRAQIQCLRAFGDADVHSQLHLTDDQREQVSAILRTGFQEAEAIRESLTELQRRTLEKATAVLTDEQRMEWEQLQQQQQHVELGVEPDYPLNQGGYGPRRRPGRRGQRMGGAGSARPRFRRGF
jgi:hypothetical protein